MASAKLKALLRVQKKYLICGAFCVFLMDFFGFFAHLFEENFNDSFQYPYKGDISSFVVKLQQGLKPEVDPINVYNFSYLHSNSEKCKNNKPRLVYIVKSSLENFEKREVIRRTWGFEKRFSDVIIRRVFVLGSTKQNKLQLLIDNESKKYGDIIQLDFLDTYYNNTIKTMSAFKWLIEFCSHSRYYFFSDDDMYISTKNVLRFLRNPAEYPDYLQLPPSMLGTDSFKSSVSKQKTDFNMGKNIPLSNKNSYKYDLPNNITLYAGFVFVSSPHRHKSSKWYVSLKEYPYNLWPPYVTAGAYVLSNKALFKIYFTSFYTKHFRFDDIYLGLVALKAGIQPFHCDQFYFYKKKYNVFNYKYVVASHGYDNPKELEYVWNEQKEAGNA